MPPPSVVQTELIRQLEADGVFSPAAARAAIARYVTSDPPTTAARAAALLTLSGAIKALAVAALLLALSALLKLATPCLSRFPIHAYQLPLLAVAAGAALRPDRVWRAQAPYVALLATFSTYIVLAWMLRTHPTRAKRLLSSLHRNLVKTGAGGRTRPRPLLLAAASLAFFAAAAHMHASPILAVAAAGCLTWTLTEACPPAVLWLPVAGHLAPAAAFITAKAAGAHPRLVFTWTYAAEHYCMAAAALWLWVGCQEGRIRVAGAYTAAFAALAAAACAVHYALAIKTPASVCACFALPVLATWVWRLKRTAGGVATLALAAGLLFGCGLLLDRYQSLLVFEAPQRPGSAVPAAGRAEAS